MTEWILALILLLAQMTGLDRTQSAVLMDVAQQRSAEIAIAGSFSHRPIPELSQWSWGEVIAWNSGFSDPVTATAGGWRDSAPHHAVLWNTLYREIGCGITYAAPRYFFACIVGTRAEPSRLAPAPAASGDGIPNTAMSSPAE